MQSHLLTYFEWITKNSRLPLIISVVLGLFIFNNLWQVVATFKINDIPPINVLPIHKTISAPIDIAQFHLFGVYDQNLNDLPATQLQLILQGITFGLGDSNESRALIAAPNQATKVYKIGDSILNGTVIREIMRDHVVIDDNGRLESLNLPVPQVTGTITQAH